MFQIERDRNFRHVMDLCRTCRSRGTSGKNYIANVLKTKCPNWSSMHVQIQMHIFFPVKLYFYIKSVWPSLPPLLPTAVASSFNAQACWRGFCEIQQGWCHVLKQTQWCVYAIEKKGKSYFLKRFISWNHSRSSGAAAALPPVWKHKLAVISS